MLGLHIGYSSGVCDLCGHLRDVALAEVFATNGPTYYVRICRKCLIQTAEGVPVTTQGTATVH